MAVEKTRNSGTLTEAGFNSLITSALRKANSYWKPKQQCIKDARVARGQYMCSSCHSIVPTSVYGVYKSGKKKGKPRKIKNIVADHIEPVVDPHVGFQGWDVYIKRMFIETGWQAICRSCHSIKTAEESAIAAERRRDEKH
jgi:hypothetical protein